jgi:hypothetical protein
MNPKPTNQQPTKAMSEQPTEYTVNNSSLLAAFAAGQTSVEPFQIFPGTVAAHKDITLRDVAREALAAKKAETDGPANPAGVEIHQTPQSFAMAVAANEDSRTRVFADAEKWKITAVFDYLEDGGRSYQMPADGRKIGWGQHRAEIDFRESRKVKEWRKALEWLGQAEFANFLEDHLEDVTEPAGSDLLGIVTDLEATVGGGFKGRVNLDNGGVSLHFQSEVETAVEIPRVLKLSIPLFEHGDRYLLPARLRFQITGGTVKFRLIFTNLDDAKEQEFTRIVKDIDEQISSALYMGRLELPW